jgi:DNA-binding LacI/PurR family transcriptional regulator
MGLRCVWFDDIDGGAPDVRREDRGRFTRCHYDERRGIRAAVDHLVSLGHRSAGYPVMKSAPWKRERLRQLREEAVLAGGTLDVGSEPHLPEGRLLSPPLVKGLAELTGTGSADAARCIASAREVLRLRLVALLPFVADGRTTALIVPNDSAARYTLLTLGHLRICTPQHLSLLSFDNSLSVQSQPISSVDFGFGYLGYSAFHAILGDVPLSRDRHGNIAATARVVDRGSTGPPRVCRPNARVAP